MIFFGCFPLGLRAVGFLGFAAAFSALSPARMISGTSGKGLLGSNLTVFRPVGSFAARFPFRKAISSFTCVTSLFFSISLLPYSQWFEGPDRGDLSADKRNPVVLGYRCCNEAYAQVFLDLFFVSLVLGANLMAENALVTSKPTGPSQHQLDRCQKHEQQNICSSG